MQNEDEQLKTTGGGEKVTWSGKARLWSSAVVEGGGDSGGVFLPSLLSSASLLSPLSSVFFFSVIFSFSPLSLRGCQLRLGGALWRWRGSTVAAVVVSSSPVFFLPLSLPVLPRFFDGFPFSPLSSLSVSLLFLFSPLISSVSVCFSTLLSL